MSSTLGAIWDTKGSVHQSAKVGSIFFFILNLKSQLKGGLLKEKNADANEEAQMAKQKTQD